MRLGQRDLEHVSVGRVRVVYLRGEDVCVVHVLYNWREALKERGASDAVRGTKLARRRKTGGSGQIEFRFFSTQITSQITSHSQSPTLPAHVLALGRTTELYPWRHHPEPLAVGW